MASEKLFHVGVKALIVNDEGKILVMDVNTTDFIKVNKIARWDIPGGRIQQGMTALETLQREVLEETGIEKIVKAEYMTGVISTIEIPLPDGSKVGLVLVVYKVKVPPNSVIKLSSEHTGYEWVDQAEAARRLSFKYPEEFTNAL